MIGMGRWAVVQARAYGQQGIMTATVLEMSEVSMEELGVTTTDSDREPGLAVLDLASRLESETEALAKLTSRLRDNLKSE